MAMLLHCSLLVSIGAVSALQEGHLGACLDGDLQCYAADASYMSDTAQPNYDVQLLQREVTHTKHEEMPRLNHDEHGNVAESTIVASVSVAGSGGAAGTAHASDHSEDGGGGTNESIATPHYRIPLVLHWTGNAHMLGALEPQFQDNLKAIISANPLFRFKYWDDDACLAYIQKYYTEDIVLAFQNSSRGPYSGAYRGDICRTAVLSREGGFYMDLDVELAKPLMELIDYETTFMSIRNSNALFAAEPNCSILRRAVDRIIPWYQLNDAGKNPDENQNWLGPSILGQALEIECNCLFSGDHEPWAWRVEKLEPCPKEYQMPCRDQEIRLYEEEAIPCDVVSEECPKERHDSVEKLGRKNSKHLMIGFKTQDGETLGWPRFASCPGMGCGGSGHVPGYVAPITEKERKERKKHRHLKRRHKKHKKNEGKPKAQSEETKASAGVPEEEKKDF